MSSSGCASSSASGIAGYRLPFVSPDLELYATAGVRYQRLTRAAQGDARPRPHHDAAGGRVEDWADPIVGVAAHWRMVPERARRRRRLRRRLAVPGAGVRQHRLPVDPVVSRSRVQLDASRYGALPRRSRWDWPPPSRLSACVTGGQEATLVSPRAMTGERPTSIRSEALIGRWGVASFRQEKDRQRLAAQARAQCKLPYTITRGPTGGVMMHVADDSPSMSCARKAARTARPTLDWKRRPVMCRIARSCRSARVK